MSHRVSIAQARNELTRLIRRVEEGERVELTRRGKPVAALVGYGDYRHLVSDAGSFASAVAAFRARLTEEDMKEVSEALEGVRDFSPGRRPAL